MMRTRIFRFWENCVSSTVAERKRKKRQKKGVKRTGSFFVPQPSLISLISASDSFIKKHNLHFIGMWNKNMCKFPTAYWVVFHLFLGCSFILHPHVFWINKRHISSWKWLDPNISVCCFDCLLDFRINALRSVRSVQMSIKASFMNVQRQRNCKVMIQNEILELQT